MKRLHVSMKVKNLQESVDFYSALFNAPPTKIKEDYAQWLLDDPRVNFSIALHSGEEPGLLHLGVQAETEEELAEVYDNLSNARGMIREEGKTICCYAQSEKSWIKDPSGVDWEAFYTFGDASGFYTDNSA